MGVLPSTLGKKVVFSRARPDGYGMGHVDALTYNGKIWVFYDAGYTLKVMRAREW
jgi:hypothetical protein